MSSIAVCEGNLMLDPAGFMSCSGSWSVVPYVEPTDTTAIYAQLVALNELDPTVVGLLVSGALVIFIIGYSAGMVLKRLKQA